MLLKQIPYIENLTTQFQEIMEEEARKALILLLAGTFSLVSGLVMFFLRPPMQLMTGSALMTILDIIFAIIAGSAVGLGFIYSCLSISFLTFFMVRSCKYF